MSHYKNFSNLFGVGTAS